MASLCFPLLGANAASPPVKPYGLASRAVPPPYLNMPHSGAGKLPQLLSQTGVFQDTAHLVVREGLIPYELQVPFWSDGADKLRWISLPQGKIGFAPRGEWTFPAGTILVKTFELPLDEAHPQLQRRLETRLLVRDSAGGVYGALYKWRADNSDADLLPGSLSEDIPVRRADGTTATQNWY